MEALRARPAEWLDAEEVAAHCGTAPDTETVFHLLRHLEADPARGVRGQPGKTVLDRRYRLEETKGARR
jgi:hypothetical protein